MLLGWPQGCSSVIRLHRIPAMDKTFFAKANWYLRRSLNRLGLPGIVGLGLFAFSLAFYLSALAPLQNRQDKLRREIEVFRQKARLPGIPASSQADPAEQLSAFYRFFPATDSAPDELAKLYDAAREQNFTLEQGEYRLVRDRNGKALRYEIVLPVKAAYPQIRKFLAKALADIPSMSLDNVTFQRQKIGDALVESQVRLTLYLGDAR